MHLRIPSSWLNMAKLLVMICLLLITAEISQAQSTPTLSINDIAVNETDFSSPTVFGYDFTIRLSAPSANVVSVQACTQDGSATGNVDFVAGCTTVTIPAGQTSNTLQIFIKGDTIVEGTEQFFVNLSNPVNATIARGQGVATIIDDDTLLLLNQTSSSRGLAVDSVFHTHEPFAINTGDLPFYSSDQRNRIVVFAIGLKLAQGENASAVTATAEDSVGTIRPLTVEFVGVVPNNNLWLTQVVLKLSDQLPAGDQKIRISLHGQTSNAVLVAVTP